MMNTFDPKKDYGFTKIGVREISQLPEWDLFRYKKIQYIFETSEIIFDFGRSSRALSELFADILKEREFKTIDLRDDIGVDIVTDICVMDCVQSQSVDAIICSAVLQFVYDPFKAVEELYRILKPKGKMFVYVAWIYNYCGDPSGKFLDYYRFSPDGIKYLFREFKHVEISPVRGRIGTILNLTKKFGKRSIFQKYLGGLIDKMDSIDFNNASGYNVYLEK
ncbi:MAG: methyltransferase domain-containing protein [Candidatus Omnitrophica bacterium]|nr:methyltransferase domain-containing protein [Candidatus Omnitrophota bacterium]MCB9747908.1 methyltransferase domain-containing protein [Candidatus Omnitrophota bacterium]